MKPLLPLLCFPLLLAAGCNTAPPPPPEKPQAPVTDDGKPPVVQENPVEKKDELYEQLHGGMFAVGTAVDKIAKASEMAKDMQATATPEDKEAVADLVATLDDTGATLADYGADGPTEDEVKSDRTKYSAKRSNMVDAITDSLKDLREQEGVMASMEEMASGKTKETAAKLDKLLNACIDDLMGALEELGVKTDVPDTAG